MEDVKLFGCGAGLTIFAVGINTFVDPLATQILISSGIRMRAFGALFLVFAEPSPQLCVSARRDNDFGRLQPR